MFRAARMLFILSCLLGVLTGCSNSDAPTAANIPEAPEPPVVASSIVQTDSGFEGIVASFNVTVDVDSLTATVEPVRSTNAQPPQAIYYDLDIAQFLQADSFAIEGIRSVGDSALLLSYSHAHPFDAPNLESPITGLNRADLGYTGRMLVLAESSTESYFNDFYQLDPRLVINADGYVHPRDVLADGGLSNNTFPYKLLVDEVEDNRADIGNGGDPEGNYVPEFGGWQRPNLGPQGNGWTGYDFLHGGQTATGSFLLDLETLESFNEFNIAILIKYTDPRGQGGKDFRLPPVVTDVTQFAYRLPFAALDNSKVDVVGGEIQITGSPGNLQVNVRDWDTRADEAGDADLSDETDVSLIQPGASGIPFVDFVAPDILSGGVALNGLRGTGIPGDEMEYGVEISNDQGAPAGLYHGLVRVSDKEALLDRSGYHFGVDPFTVEPTRTPVPAVTVQVVPIRIGAFPPQILNVEPTGAVGTIGDVVRFDVSFEGEANTYLWDFGGGASPDTSSAASPSVFLNKAGSFTGTVKLTNSDGGSDLLPFEFSIQGAGPPAVWTTSPTGIPDALNPVILFPTDNPVIVYGEDDGLYEIKVATSSVPDPDGAEDWSVHRTGTGWLQTERAFYDSVMDAVVHNNSIVIANTTGFVAISNSLTPDSISDWDVHGYDTDAQGGRTPSILSFGSHLVIGYSNADGPGGGAAPRFLVAWSSVPDPAESDDWELVPVASYLGGATSVVTQMHMLPSIDGDGLAFKYVFDTNLFARIQVSFANSTTPLITDFTFDAFSASSTTSSLSTDFAEINGRYMILHTNFLGQDNAWISTNSSPEKEDWEYVPFDGIFDTADLHLVEWQSRPLAFVRKGGFSSTDYFAMRGLTPFPMNRGDWETVDVGGAPFGTPDQTSTDLVIRGDQLIAAFPDNVPEELLWAATSDPW